MRDKIVGRICFVNSAIDDVTRGFTMSVNHGLRKRR
jgi:hypothetical protein